MVPTSSRVRCCWMSCSIRNTLYQPTATDAYRDELRQYLLRVPEEDEEQQLEALRQFKQAQMLRVAAATSPERCR
nr:hypothetical protein [Enterobacter asburiae]